MKVVLLLIWILILAVFGHNGQESSCADTFDLKSFFGQEAPGGTVVHDNNAAVLSDAVTAAPDAQRAILPSCCSRCIWGNTEPLEGSSSISS